MCNLFTREPLAPAVNNVPTVPVPSNAALAAVITDWFQLVAGAIGEIGEVFAAMIMYP
jgi:hypothetical protein